MTLDELLKQYEKGPDLLKTAIAGVREDQFDQTPVPGKWSIRQVVCHIADFEPVYADRMKRVLVEDNPTMFGGDPDVFAAGLHYDKRNVHEELELISVVRRQMAVILRNTDVEDFQRTGVHSEAGPLTLETLLERITRHIPHHLTFIEAKIAAMR
ncbi:MAG: DinB family protein [Fuerstia sp.]|nr:DinB family protein [Fuerstiella sp.]